jgi:hypothetical protein
MADDTLTTAKAADGFSTESPIRAFTDFQVAGNYAIGKGFRPSLAHLSRYLDAMERKEGWALVQVILPINADNDPTIIFVKLTINAAFDLPREPRFSTGGVMEYEKPNTELRHIGDHIGSLEAGARAVLAPFADDPTNPKHYNGRECADIGERLSANGYQVLKYCWRLGKKDDPCVELGKALWYLKSEFDLIQSLGGGSKFHPIKSGIRPEHRETFLEDRLTNQSEFTKTIARALWAGYDLRGIYPIRVAIEEHRNRLDCGNGLAI